MKTSKRYTVNASRIKSLKDLQVEKERLRLEILKKEQEIHGNYRNIAQALSPRHILSSVSKEVMTTSNVVSKAFALGKAFVAKRKKRKHDRTEAANDEPRP